MDAYEAVTEAISEHEYIVHHRDEKGYDHLEEEGSMIEVLNENKGDEMFVEFNQGEATIFFGNNHDHFSLSFDDEIYWLVDLIDDIFNNRMCAVTLYGYRENANPKLLGTGFVKDKDLKNSSLDKIFEYVYEIEEYKMMLEHNGGKAIINYWDPSLNKEIELGKKQ